MARALRALTAALADILGSKLVGVYLHGSLTQRAFDRARSDVDCIVVARRDLTHAQLERLRTWLARAATADPWISRIQMQILFQDRLLRPDARGCLYQFGALTRSGSDGNPIIWMNVLATGLTLAGPRPDRFLPPITAEMVFAALVREIGYLHAEIGDPASPWRGRRFYRAYAVLTLCRILYSHEKGRIVSKPQATRWALRTLAPRWHPLIREAMASDRGRVGALTLPRIARFIEFAEGQVTVPGTPARAPRTRPPTRASGRHGAA